MTGELKDTNDRIDKLREDMTGELKETNDRIDKLREDMTGEMKEMKKYNEEAFARVDKNAEKNRKEIKNEIRWFMGTIIAVMVLMFAGLALISSG